MTAYYNEFDPFAAQWLRNLIAAGHIAPGDVDERSIVDVKPEDLRGYAQCHFFAGIGGWSLALRLAGWGDDQPVWTGSCPCQPLSSAGQRKGHADERHLWPAFHGLISECAPSVLFGEQTSGKDAREWLSGVRADLEALGYACGAADLCAAGVGAPHIRQRLFWVADAGSYRWKQGRCDAAGCCAENESGPPNNAGHVRARGVPDWNGATIAVERADGWARIAAQPALFPVAPRIPGDVGRLRGAGNAIVPQVAAEFIAAFLECRP